LMDWQNNTGWQQAGQVRNLGYSFRVDQLKTQATNGASAGQMAGKPIFAKVQTIRRYNATPPRYNTVSASGR
jgi:hypothetical protein